MPYSPPIAPTTNASTPSNTLGNTKCKQNGADNRGMRVLHQRHGADSVAERFIPSSSAALSRKVVWREMNRAWGVMVMRVGSDVTDWQRTTRAASPTLDSHANYHPPRRLCPVGR